MRESFSGIVQINNVFPGTFGGAVFTGKEQGKKYVIKFRASYKKITRVREPGEFWKIKGSKIKTENYGQQIRVEELILVPLPSENYLSSLLIKHPKFRGIGLGPRKVKVLMEKVGAIELIRLMDAGNYIAIADVIAEPIAKALCLNWNPLHNEMKLARFLMENNFEPSLSKKIIKVCKFNTLERIKKNPYGLLALGTITKNFWNTIDKAAEKLQFSKDCTQRKIGAVEYALYQQLQHGNTAMSDDKLRKSILGLLGTKEYCENAIEEAGKVKAICCFIKDEIKYFQAVGVATIESQLEKNIARLRSEKPIRIFTKEVLVEAINEFSDKNEIELGYLLTEQQKDSIKLSISKRISIITGYGGTGKTTILKGTVNVAEQQLRSVFIVALSGKAKERAREAIDRDDITFTIHAFIKMISNDKNKNKLTNPLIIIDEASMVDIVLANRLMNALHDTNFSMVLVGDTAQLSPVGLGIFFHACVNKLDTINLTKVHRQAETSPIHKLAMLVRKGQINEIKEWNHENNGVFFVTCEPNQRALINSIINITSIQMGQVISPHASSYMSDNTASINNSMQYTYNQGSKVCLNLGNRILKVNDPIMVTDNNYELELFNGMTGVIEDIEDIELINNEPHIMVKFNNLTYRLSKNQCFELGIELAYAITIHKSQGSEYDVTIICCINASKLLERSMVYTALTRSKKLTLFVGNINILNNAVTQLPRFETICHGFQIE
jgi:exodeoxyribonuclease V alpha subunit